MITETDSKRLARLAVYRRAEELQPRIAGMRSSHLAFAGVDAGELGCLRYFRKTDPADTWFFDNDTKKGLQHANRVWPEVQCCFGDIRRAAKFVYKPASFIHLDFCGHWKQEQDDVLRKLTPLLGDWCVVFSSFFRGREQNPIVEPAAATPDGKRFVNVARRMQNILGAAFVPVFSLRYTGVVLLGPSRIRVYPMGIVGFQRVPSDHVENVHWLTAVNSPTPYGGFVPTDPRLLQEHLRVEALGLRQRGLGTKEVAAVLNLKPGTIAAWFAHQTRHT